MNNGLNGKHILQAKDVVIQVFDWGELHWYASKQIGNSNLMTIGKCILKPGCENPRHYHPNCEEVLQVIRGSIQHTFGDDVFEMEAGDTIVVPSNIVHNARNVSSEDAIMTIAFSSAERQTVGEF
jgi:quercetin dioxygenase-like cupin family protein